MGVTCSQKCRLHLGLWRWPSPVSRRPCYARPRARRQRRKLEGRRSGLDSGTKHWRGVFRATERGRPAPVASSSLTGPPTEGHQEPGQQGDQAGRGTKGRAGPSTWTEASVRARGRREVPEVLMSRAPPVSSAATQLSPPQGTGRLRVKTQVDIPVPLGGLPLRACPQMRGKTKCFQSQ